MSTTESAPDVERQPMEAGQFLTKLCPRDEEVDETTGGIEMASICRSVGRLIKGGIMLDVEKQTFLEEFINRTAFNLGNVPAEQRTTEWDAEAMKIATYLNSLA